MENLSAIPPNQLNGEFKIKDKGLQPLFIDIWNLKQDFKKVKFIHVTRDKNKNADRMVNKALDTLGL
ncbi:MAG: Ribonuclease H [Parcubacteria group bacterium GW2011_GWA2_46_10]|nr:MAG: Ribonuclease H [Parcubacteria group bacterium GW2011_GWA2_46_10]